MTCAFCGMPLTEEDKHGHCPGEYCQKSCEVCGLETTEEEGE